MITFLRFVLLCLMASSAFAQSSLPACQGSDISSWNNCFGTETTAIGNKYVGEYQDGKFNGQGTVSSAFGKYVGEFKDGKLNGLAIEYRANGTIIRSGLWTNYQLVQSFAIDTNRFPFNQPAQTAQPSSAEKVQLNTAAQSQLPACQGSEERWTNCFGTLNLANGNKFNGEFKNGKLTGHGTYTFANGDKYVGEFISFAANGQGIEYNSSGSITRQGRWENNRLVQSFAIDAQRFPFNASLTASATQAPVPDPLKDERDRLAADLEASRKNAKDLEERLAVAQAASSLTIRPTLGVPTGRRVALVIGNAQYKSSPLENSVNDATDIDQALKRFGFQTTFLRNASLGQMRESTRRFADQLSNADVALIYFAGHGIESKNKNFMIPVNADIKFEYELADQAYDAGAWLEMLEMIKSNNAERVNIVILDACRNNNLIGSRSLNRGLGRMDAPAGTFLSYSTAPGKVAADGGKGERNSPFTRNLLKAIQQPGQPIEEVFKEVRRNVTRETNGAQVPWESTSLTGFFSFRQTR